MKRIRHKIAHLAQKWHLWEKLAVLLKPAALFALILSFFFISFLILRAFVGPTGARQHGHLSLFGTLHVEPTSPHVPFVWLFFGAHKETPGFMINCFSRNRQGMVLKSAEYVGQLQSAPLQCLWTIYRVKCPVVEDMTDFAISGPDDDTENKGVRVPYRSIDRTRRDVVVCQSRFFMYDKWQIMFTVIELYRFYGADLIATYVDSIISEAFEFLRVYRDKGLVVIHPAVRYEEFSGLEYNPNKETEYNQQLPVYQLCLHEYRESADFIIFGDWDELLVPHNASTLFEELSILLTEYPNAAAFRFQRMHVQNFLPKQASFFDMGDFLNSTHSTDKFGETKVVVVGGPRVDSIGIHRMWWGAGGYQEILLTTEHSMFLHFREEGKRTCDGEEVNELFPSLNTTELAENFTSFIERSGLYPTYVNLPSELVYTNSYISCYQNLSRTLDHPEWGICPNHLVCPRPVVDYGIRCHQMQLKFAQFKLKEDIVISYPERIFFEMRWDGCF